MATYNPLQSITLASNASSVTFSGISQDYTDLVLVSQTQQVTSSEDLAIRFNNDSTSVYSRTYICGDGSTAHSGRSTSQSYIILDHHGTPPTSTSFGSSIVNIPNYSNTTLNKTVLNRNGSIDSPQAIATVANVGLWRSQAAITSITVLCTNSSNLKAGSTFDLYGIKSGAPQALGGDTVTTDGNYWYHTFRSTGAFIPQKPLSVDYLVVAGGAGGGNHAAGGGGAGGLRSTVTATGGGGSLESALSVTATSYTVTVGAGGAGMVSQGNSGVSLAGNNGSNSVFASITSTGGGGGGAIGATTGKTGGSGGGGGGATTASGGSPTANQGYSGGAANSTQSGGGGGAGAAGSTSAGGNGVAVAISGSSVTYAGGGGGGQQSGGGSGGTGGGGNGGNNTGGSPTSGTANTGGGGGGHWYSEGTNATNAGGSGIVIVRYPV
jgi:hypothetical protein